ncbi:putative F-box/LRR-repeat protein 23 [Impatiens glandulifera]|uniref:putative F-box/LRR-repeat protein 23 n=1 Tax=Impatiens glandulifera TaxID=253017 RepID=UPI001FB0FE44|nr:putative F-box/LRR-repeat protein 23 [Impatiens glandulifera]
MPPYSRSHLRNRRKKAFYYRSRRARKGKEVVENQNLVNNLPRDVLVAILQKVGTIDIMLNVQKVCVLWYKICQEPVIWRSIDIHSIGKLCNLPDSEATYDDIPYDIETITEVAIDRSCGQLININLEYFGNDDLLKYITDRKIQLKRLRLVWSYITDDGLSEAAKKMPSLEELHIDFGGIKYVGLENVGLNCPGLKSLTYKRPGIVTKIDYEELSGDEINIFEYEEEYDVAVDPNSVALAISRTMPQLQHLNLIGNGLTNEGLQAILDSCPRLESLDLRKCFRVDLTSDLELGKRCSSIKTFCHPDDSTGPGDHDAFESYYVADHDVAGFDLSDNED